LKVQVFIIIDATDERESLSTYIIPKGDKVFSF